MTERMLNGLVDTQWVGRRRSLDTGSTAEMTRESRADSENWSQSRAARATSVALKAPCVKWAVGFADLQVTPVRLWMTQTPKLFDCSPPILSLWSTLSTRPVLSTVTPSVTSSQAKSIKMLGITSHVMLFCFAFDTFDIADSMCIRAAFITNHLAMLK